MSATLHAYMTEYSEARGQDLHSMPADKLAAALFYSSSASMDRCGWIKVGTAEVTVRLDPRETVIGSAVARLRAEQSKVRADAESRATALERQIQSLLCIEGGAAEIREGEPA